MRMTAKNGGAETWEETRSLAVAAPDDISPDNVREKQILHWINPWVSDSRLM